MLYYSIPTILPTVIILVTTAIFVYLGWSVLTHH